jgi:DNA-binding NarL/FixJ family response regulator
VLIVDDHPSIRKALREVIDSCPLLQLVGEAADGEQAVLQARALRPDVVLMDIYIPRLDGLDATRQIKLEYPSIAVIVLSINNDGRLGAAAQLAGASAFILKGCDADHLCREVCAVYAAGCESGPSILGPCEQTAWERRSPPG